MENSFKAEVVSPAIARDGKTNISKQNSGVYNLHRVLVLDGPLKGNKVLGQRTILNKDGEDKAPCQVGDEVTIHMSIVDSTTEPGKKAYFFEIEKESTLNNDAIAALLANAGQQM